MTDGGNVEGAVSVEPVEPDFTVTLAGRAVGFKAFTGGQLVTIQALLGGARDERGHFGALVASWNAILSRVIDPEDRKFLIDASLNGELGLLDALSVMRQGAPGPEDDDAEVKVSLKPKRSVANAARKRR